MANSKVLMADAKLYDYSSADILNSMINDVMNMGICRYRKDARKLIINAIIANNVQSAIFEQIEWLIENNGYQNLED